MFISKAAAPYADRTSCLQRRWGCRSAGLWKSTCNTTELEMSATIVMITETFWKLSALTSSGLSAGLGSKDVITGSPIQWLFNSQWRNWAQVWIKIVVFQEEIERFLPPIEKLEDSYFWFDLRRLSAVSVEFPDTTLMRLLAPSKFIHTHAHARTHAHIHKWPRKIKLVPFVRPLHEETSPRDGSPGRDQRRFVGHLGHLHRHHSFQLPPPPPPRQQLTYNLCSTSFNPFPQVTGRSLTHSHPHSTSKLLESSLATTLSKWGETAGWWR